MVGRKKNREDLGFSNGKKIMFMLTKRASERERKKNYSTYHIRKYLFTFKNKNFENKQTYIHIDPQKTRTGRKVT